MSKIILLSKRVGSPRKGSYTRYYAAPAGSD